MFDISFTEILVIAVVALVILGPERLPHVARTLGHLFGRAQRYANQVKSDIQREMELDELKKLKIAVQDAAHSMENSMQGQINQVQELADAAEAKSVAATTSVPPGIPAEAAPTSETLATPAKPVKPRSTKPIKSKPTKPLA